MPVKAQNIFKSRDPLVDEPLKTDWSDFSFWQAFLNCLEDILLYPNLLSSQMSYLEKGLYRLDLWLFFW